MSEKSAAYQLVELVARESKHNSWRHINPARRFGDDYTAAWKACDNGHWLNEYLFLIGAKKRRYGCSSSVPDAIRKRWSWKKVQEQIYRHVRRQRGLPLKDPACEKRDST